MNTCIHYMRLFCFSETLQKNASSRLAQSLIFTKVLIIAWHVSDTNGIIYKIKCNLISFSSAMRRRKYYITHRFHYFFHVAVTSTIKLKPISSEYSSDRRGSNSLDIGEDH